MHVEQSTLCLMMSMSCGAFLFLFFLLIVTVIGWFFSLSAFSPSVINNIWKSISTKKEKKKLIEMKIDIFKQDDENLSFRSF